MKTVAIQGGPASYSELAARRLFGDRITLHHHVSFEEAIEQYRQDTDTGLLLPWWNRSIGPIFAVQRLIRHLGIDHCTEIELPVRHCLIGQPGSFLYDGGKVYSHPAALAQCRRFFRQFPRLEACKDHDTADSVRRLAREREQGVFAIASAEAARHHGMTVLLSDIQDQGDNATLFRGYKPAGAAALSLPPQAESGYPSNSTTASLGQ